MVFAFLEGVHKDKLNKNNVMHLAKILQKLHAIEVEKISINSEIKNKTEEVLKAFKTIEKYPKEFVLCHNDLNPKNIFFYNDIKFIDWEYAGVNDKYFDLACVCEEFRLNGSLQKVFLELYFENQYVVEKLEAYKVLYKALCKEWFTSFS